MKDGRSLIQAIQGNFDHLMGLLRTLTRSHNRLVDDVQGIAGSVEEVSLEVDGKAPAVHPHAHSALTGITANDHHNEIHSIKSHTGQLPIPIMFGQDGEDGISVVGPRGATGAQGPQGDPGPAGADGAGGSGVPYFPDINEDPWGMPVPGPDPARYTKLTTFYGHEHFIQDALDLVPNSGSGLGGGEVGMVPRWDGADFLLDQLTADEIPVTDVGGYFTGTDVEAALQELGAGGTGTPGKDGAPGFPGADGEDFGMWVPPKPVKLGAVWGRNHKGSNQALTGSGAWYGITFGAASAEFPVGFFDNTTDAYIIPDAGKYYFEANVTWDIPATNHTERKVRILVNGTAVAYGHLTVSSTTDPSSVRVSYLGELVAGDDITLEGFSDDGASAAGYRILGGADETYFNGFKLGGPQGETGPAGADGAPGADGGVPTPPGLWYPEPEEFGMWVPRGGGGGDGTSGGGGGVFRDSVKKGQRAWVYTECMTALGGTQPPAGGQADWLAYASGTSASCTAGDLVEANHPGIIRCYTGTTSIGRSAVFGGQASNSPVAAREGGAHFITWLKTGANLSVSTQRYRVEAGWSHQPTATVLPTGDAIIFTYTDDDATSGANWVLAAVNGGVAATPVNSGIAVATNTWYKMEILISEDGSTATFRIDGVTVGSIGSGLPSTNLSPMVGICKRVGTTARFIYVDAIAVDYPITR